MTDKVPLESVAKPIHRAIEITEDGQILIQNQQSVRENIEEVVRSAVLGSADEKHVDDLEEGAINLRIFADRIRRAAYGYAGFFDAVRVNSGELEKLYTFDQALLENVDELARAIDNVAETIATEGLSTSIQNMVDLCQDAKDTYDQRKRVILEI